jgi:hypothetical protein
MTGHRRLELAGDSLRFFASLLQTPDVNLVPAFVSSENFVLVSKYFQDEAPAPLIHAVTKIMESVSGYLLLLL